MYVNLSKHQSQWRTGDPGVLQSRGGKESDTDFVTEQQQIFMISLIHKQTISKNKEV